MVVVIFCNNLEIFNQINGLRVVFYLKFAALGLAGGVSTSALSLRQIASGAMSPARAVGAAHNAVNPTSTRLDPRTGMQTTARRAEHMAMGRSVLARNPAYRDGLKERLASAWGKQPGGKVEK